MVYGGALAAVLKQQYKNQINPSKSKCTCHYKQRRNKRKESKDEEGAVKEKERSERETGGERNHETRCMNLKRLKTSINLHSYNLNTNENIKS